MQRRDALNARGRWLSVAFSSGRHLPACVIFKEFMSCKRKHFLNADSTPRLNLNVNGNADLKVKICRLRLRDNDSVYGTF